MVEQKPDPPAEAEENSGLGSSSESSSDDIADLENK